MPDDEGDRQGRWASLEPVPDVGSGPSRPEDVPAVPPWGGEPPPPQWGQPQPGQAQWGQPQPQWGAPPPWAAAPPPRPTGGTARTGPLPLYPMSVGDILDGSFKLFKANLRTVFLIVAVISVPVQLVSAVLLRPALEQPGILEMLEDPTVAATAAESNQISNSQAVGLVLTVLVSVLVTPFIAGAISRVVAASYLGQEVSAGEALRATGRRFGPLLASFLLVHLIELGGFLLCFFPALAFMALYVLVAPAVVVEGLGAIAAMRRSWRLVRPRFWPVLGTALLAGFIANVISQILSTGPGVIQVLFAPSWGWILLAIAGVLVAMITQPIVAIVSTLLYFDARIRQEGFDLQVMAADVKA